MYCGHVCSTASRALTPACECMFVCADRIFVILLRKFGIAFTSLMFNKNPEFQMAVALLVMFAAYALQVRPAW